MPVESVATGCCMFSEPSSGRNRRFVVDERAAIHFLAFLTARPFPAALAFPLTEGPASALLLGSISSSNALILACQQAMLTVDFPSRHRGSYTLSSAISSSSLSFF